MLGTKIMAVRKKSEAIHFRVSPMFKAYLEGAANAIGKTSTQMVEDSVTGVADKISIDMPNLEINPDFLEEDGSLQLRVALEAAYFPGEPALTKLRTYYIADVALSSRDKIISRTIIESPNCFAGKTEIFSVSDGIIATEYISHYPAVDLDKISKSMPSLEAFAAFREKNTKIKLSYEAFLEMIDED
jgi:uncharacterized protein (DUF1778 family)